MTNTQSSSPFTAAELLQHACGLVAEGDDVSHVWIVFPDDQITSQIQQGQPDSLPTGVEFRIEAPGQISVLRDQQPDVPTVQTEHHFRWWHFINMSGLQEGTR